MWKSRAICLLLAVAPFFSVGHFVERPERSLSGLSLADRATLLLPSDLCNASSQCLSGNCAQTGSSCSGGKCEFYGTCWDGYYSYQCPGPTCTQLPLGSPCRDIGDCLEGQCGTNKTCVPSKDGDYCLYESQCTGAAVCGSAERLDYKQCHTPANHSLYPQEACAIDAQCFSGKCRYMEGSTNDEDQYYTTDYEHPKYGPPPFPRCDYLALGQGACRTYIDCAVGTCKSGICAKGVTGDQCLLNQHCAGVCSTKGKCYSPPTKNGNLTTGLPCVKNGSCYSGICGFGEVTRPTPLHPGWTAEVEDGICAPSPAGGRCRSDSECYDSVCRSGVCKTRTTTTTTAKSTTTLKATTTVKATTSKVATTTTTK